MFEELGALDQLEAFASLNGPKFYGLKPNSGTVTLERAPFEMPAVVAEEVGGLRPFRAGETLGWRVV